jgi:hypothetical protein
MIFLNRVIKGEKLPETPTSDVNPRKCLLCELPALSHSNLCGHHRDSLAGEMQ